MHLLNILAIAAIAFLCSAPVTYYMVGRFIKKRRIDAGSVSQGWRDEHGGRKNADD